MREKRTAVLHKDKPQLQDRRFEQPDHDPEQWQEWMDWSKTSETGSNANAESEPRTPLESAIQLPSPQASVSSDVGSTLIRKRKASDSSDKAQDPNAIDCTDDHAAAQNKSHSIVEKRYRTNLNQKINDLGDCIPHLRANKSARGSQDDASSALKHNKATVLSEAVAYIKFLERRNVYLEQSNLALQEEPPPNKIRPAQSQPLREAVDGGRPPQSKVVPSAKGYSPSSDDAKEDSPPVSKRDSGEASPQSRQGIIKVPDEWKRMWKGELKPYAAQREPRTCKSADEPSGRVKFRGSRQAGRLMLGSLAGVMLVDGFASRTQDTRDDRGLSSVPLLRHWPKELPSLPSTSSLGDRYLLDTYHHSNLLQSLLQVFAIFGLLGLLLFIYLFNSRPPARRKGSSTPVLEPAPSIASPKEVRQRAFLTAIQTIWFPHHHAFSEMLALNIETAAYIVRQLLGWQTYSWLTGRSEEEEIARVRAWDIAIDAQLSGGDPEVSKSRLVLSLWASGTLPNSPARFMLKALHIRILFWQPSSWPWLSHKLHEIAWRLSSWQWSEACKLQRKLDAADGTVAGPLAPEPLTEHLRYLLSLSHHHVMSDDIMLKAHNLTWNAAPSQKKWTGDLQEDDAMRGPLDALASWYSDDLLNNVLKHHISESPDTAGYDTLQKLSSASDCAPPGSLSKTRALALKAVLEESCRPSTMKDLVRQVSSTSVPDDDSSHQTRSFLLSCLSEISKAGSHDITLCASAVVIMCSLQDATGAPHLTKSVEELIESTVAPTGSLGWAAVLHTCRHMHPRISRNKVEASIALLRENLKASSQMESETKAALTEAFTRIFDKEAQQERKGKRRISGASDDTGYASMSDDDDVDEGNLCT